MPLMFRSCKSGVLLALVTALCLLTMSIVANAQANDDGLTARIEQLEQQIVELQVTIGTLETLAKSRPTRGAAYQSSGSSGNSGDIRQLEIQMRAMSGQLAALSRDVRALQSGVSNSGSIANNSYAQPLNPQPSRSGGELDGFGSVTVTPEQGQWQNRGQTQDITRDPIGNILSNEQAAPKKVASAPSVPPREAYEKAYGYLLVQDYGAAEAAFSDFVIKHPKDKLAGNAQYWLGESHYVRGNYRAAANAFLKGFKTYKRSAKAPDSLLKLAMSLSRLNQKDSACATFLELTKRFPSAPTHVTRRSAAERQRAGC